MPVITFPDGASKAFDHDLSLLDIAKSLSSSLAKQSVAAEVDGVMVDMSHIVTGDAKVKIITLKDPAGLEVLRHSCAHLMAQAVKQLYPKAQVTIGPVIDNGFYYDFAYDESFTPKDLEKIEQQMQRIVKESLPVERIEKTRDEAINYFRELGEDYKVEIIKDIPQDQVLTCYKQGDFIDLCRGPHLPNTKLLKAFKLTKLAGAYWRGDSNNEMLQRIYGTAWPTKADLADYLDKLEKAKESDHRDLIKKMDLAHLQPEAPGMIFWHEQGWTLYRLLEDYIRDSQCRYGYQEVHTPPMADISLWEKSGHAEKFSDDMFLVHHDEQTFALKPMSCPCHIQIFNQGIKSYRDLPLRMAEFGSCLRNEPSGTLHGFMRLRNFVQDDAHIFCTKQQIESECISFIKQLYEIYHDFGFDNIMVKFSTRPEKRVGSDALWDHAESIMQKILDELKISWELSPGEGAFYGPKYEFSLKDCLDRVWQCGTLQLDFFLPERLGAQYVAEDGTKQVPVMLHRAAFGSIERFVGILLENFSGRLPLWIAPTQAVIFTITDSQHQYARQVAEKLQKMGIRCNLDLRNEKIGFKIREHTIKRVPYLIVLGDKECQSSTVSVRYADGEQVAGIELDSLVQRMLAEVADKSLSNKRSETLVV